MYSQVLDQLMALHPGRIRRVFKHYPLKMEGPGLLPHLASMAAFRQGNFWGMHRMLMGQPLDEAKPDLEDRARALGMNPTSFAGVAGDGSLMAVVYRDHEEGTRLGIRATPTTFLNGRRLVGSLNLAGLNTYVQAILAAKGVSATPAQEPVVLPPPAATFGVSTAAADGTACEREGLPGSSPTNRVQAVGGP
jgi:protein-disulfide isomerase